MKNSPAYLWAHGLVSQIIEGASDAFLAVMGGNTAAQIASAQLPAITPKQVLLSMVVLSGIYAASYLKKNPLPAPAPDLSALNSQLSASIPSAPAAPSVS